MGNPSLQYGAQIYGDLKLPWPTPQTVGLKEGNAVLCTSHAVTQEVCLVFSFIQICMSI